MERATTGPTRRVQRMAGHLLKGRVPRRYSTGRGGLQSESAVWGGCPGVRGVATCLYFLRGEIPLKSEQRYRCPDTSDSACTREGPHECGPLTSERPIPDGPQVRSGTVRGFGDPYVERQAAVPHLEGHALDGRLSFVPELVWHAGRGVKGRAGGEFLHPTAAQIFDQHTLLDDAVERT